MTTISRTWWGQRFLQALESFTDPARLGRGRRYAGGDRIKSCEVGKNGKVVAKVRGSVNPYYGIHKEPLYTTTVRLQPLSDEQWQRLVEHLGGQAGPLSRLLLGELPESVETRFGELGLHLLPAARGEFDNHCSCPDWADPCKHIAAVYYRLAARLDQDPLLLFELRGLPREQLHQALLQTPLGEALARSLEEQEKGIEPAPVDSYHTRPQRRKAETEGGEPLTYGAFWGEEKALPHPPEVSPPALPAVLIRKAGDYPPFWDADRSFVEVMAEFYERVRKAHQDGL
ncbi:MAG: SWIM zinc finger family protein [Candidatus Competibacteraceae bacterium]|nr:SWIM zinc finger family protein [Candidatus Competibacteraceae bacterium]